jgi:nucleoside-specific channel-forming protein
MLPVFFGGNTDAKGIWNHGSPLFMEIEPRFSIDKLTGTDLSFGPFKEWYFANNYIYDMGRNNSRSEHLVHGSGYGHRYRPANEPVSERVR